MQKKKKSTQQLCVENDENRTNERGGDKTMLQKKAEYRQEVKSE